MTLFPKRGAGGVIDEMSTLLRTHKKHVLKVGRTTHCAAVLCISNRETAWRMCYGMLLGVDERFAFGR